MRNTVVVLAFCAACQPSVDLDGRRVSTLEQAASKAVAGSTITLTEGEHRGGITLAGGVTLLGVPGAVVRTEGERAIEGLGPLSLVDVTLQGGTAEIGAIVLARDSLDLDNVTAFEGLGETAFQVTGDLSIVGSTLGHDGTAVQILSPLGRPDHAFLEASSVDGLLDLAADTIDVRTLEGTDLRLSGQTVLLQDSAVDDLEVLTPTFVTTGISVASSVWLQGESAVIAGVEGGTWQLDLDNLTIAEFVGSALVGTVGRAHLSTIEVPLLVLEGDFIDARSTRSSEVSLSANGLEVHDMRSITASLLGFGVAEEIAIEGEGASLQMGPMQARAVLVHSLQGPAHVRLEGTFIEGLLIVEPTAAVSDHVIETDSYAEVRQLTFLGGSRSSVVPPEQSVLFVSSILAGTDLGEVVPHANYIDTVLWHHDGSIDPSLAAFAGIDPMNPLFVAPGDPRMLPTSPFFHRGAFAGGPALQVEALWALREQ